MKLPAVLPEAFLRCMTASDRKTVAGGQQTFAEVTFKAEAKSERELQGQIVGWLRTEGVEVLWHRTDKKSHATIGWPDLTFAVAGHACAWEVKLPGQEPTREQSMMHERMRRDGWIISIVRHVDEARKELRTIREFAQGMAHVLLNREA